MHFDDVYGSLPFLQKVLIGGHRRTSAVSFYLRFGAILWSIGRCRYWCHERPLQVQPGRGRFFESHPFSIAIFELMGDISGNFCRPSELRV
jgi:hypothetical protein